MSRHRSSRRSGSGQILVVFVLAMVAIIGVVGLAIDGGGAYAQRRDQQTRVRSCRPRRGERLPAEQQLDPGDGPGPDRRRRRTTSPTAAGRRRSASTSTRATGSRSRSTIESPHRNSFLGALGMTNWNVTTTATALAGLPGHRRRRRAVHLLDRRVQRRRDAEVPDLDRLRRDERRRPDEREGHGLDQLRDGQRRHARRSPTSSPAAEVVTKTLDYGEYIGQHNNGNHTTLYGDVEHLPVRARRCRSRSSTPAATSWAGRRST